MKKLLKIETFRICKDLPSSHVAKSPSLPYFFIYLVLLTGEILVLNSQCDEMLCLFYQNQLWIPVKLP